MEADEISFNWVFFTFYFIVTFNDFIGVWNYSCKKSFTIPLSEILNFFKNSQNNLKHKALIFLLIYRINFLSFLMDKIIFYLKVVRITNYSAIIEIETAIVNG